jgi:hypothetical protein
MRDATAVEWSDREVDLVTERRGQPFAKAERAETLPLSALLLEDPPTNNLELFEQICFAVHAERETSPKEVRSFQVVCWFP